MISIGLAKEVMVGEKRVLLTPESIAYFVSNGYKVYVENDAGRNAGFDNCEYSRIGATIVSQKEVWELSDIVVKFKAPQKEEYDFLRDKQIIGAFMHAEGNPELLKILCQKKIRAFAFEFFMTEDRIFPMSLIDSEIAGKLAMVYGMYHLQSHLGGAGVLLSPVIGVPVPKVVVIGYGNAGNAAIRVAEALGLRVSVFGRSPERLRKYQATVNTNVKCYVYEPEIFETEIMDADLVIGAIQISTYDTPALLTEQLVKKMKKGSMIIDVTCGYGAGFMPTFDKFTSFNEPVYEKFGVLHCKIDLLPAAVPKTTTQGVSKHITPYLFKWINSFKEGVKDDISFAGMVTDNGFVVHPEVKRHLEFYE